MDAKEKARIRKEESKATLDATDLRDVSALKNREEDSEWIDPFISAFRAYLSGENKTPGGNRTEHLYSLDEISSQFKNFLLGRQPLEPTEPEEQVKAMNRLDSTRYTRNAASTDWGKGIEEIPTPMMRSSVPAALRSLRQHSRGMGGKI